jgi:EpsI family protein
LYVAYYASQRSGLSPHSPSVCIPGNGWTITNFERTNYRNNDLRLSLPLNRAIIARESNRQLVYYWFDERGMMIANEYWSKVYLLRDAIFKNRTDGALVRLTTPLYPGESENDADKRLQDFIQAVVPKLAGYLPSAMPTKIEPAITSLRYQHP